MSTTARYSYEESVRWVRNQPELVNAITFSYLDSDNRVAARRFEASEEFSDIKQLLGLTKTERALEILDLGCGNGIASYAFARCGHTVTALDPDLSEDVGLGAISRLLPLAAPGTINIRQGFAESLPFDAASFDVVYTRQALHHFRDLEAGLKECARVLKPGGRLLATREHVVDDEKQLRIFLEQHILHKMHGGENAYPLDTYLTSLRNAGFTMLRRLAPYETPINHFPVPNEEVRARITHGLAEKARLGKRIADILMKLPNAERIGRAYLSWSERPPGRLYSFLCQRRSR